MSMTTSQGSLETPLGQAAALQKQSKKADGGGIRAGQGRAGWLFIAPTLLLIFLFLIVPMLTALWVSVSNWSGKGSPLSSSYVGFKNYTALLGKSGLAQKNLGVSFRNIFYYVLLVVPLQTILALTLALAVNRRRLRGKGFFRTAFYFPSVTSSVAIAIVFLFLFNANGVINAFLRTVGVHGPNWFADPRGVLHLLLGAFGVDNSKPPGWLSGHKFLSVTWWDWLAGPSIAMCSIIFLAIWTTAGTFMLMFLAALQDVSDEVQEAAQVDGATKWQSFRRVVLPSLRPTMFLVITLGLIGTWQMFDQVFVMSKGEPGGTTVTPAYLAYTTSFGDAKWGQGAAIAFILFVVIIVFSVLQRFIMRDRKTIARSRRIATWEGKK